ncbi:Hsp20/alpha crystallin family protein [Actinomadura craniellae]|uniref:Hsp20/alpha crystallin family protein n=1 Tax=Actinomadura craniellae TaxID=2231787 RepID=A0A365GW73_9ACTN|nr:Hsp20/alpha crystallin family protein [Actinomadura craniellae]RAY11069.1 Hsp20/alpha crystallin family protein [Actinomadura craniellae]
MTQQPVRRTGRNLAALDPDREFADIYDRMDQLLSFALGGPVSTTTAQGPWVPMADVSETEDSYVIEIDLPGVRKDDVDIQLADQLLTITGEVHEQEGKRWRRRARRVGRFEFRTYLPGDVDTERVDARFEHGVLTIAVPKAEAAKPKRIEISS